MVCLRRWFIRKISELHAQFRTYLLRPIIRYVSMMK
ncbi:unnamed protein product [Acanthoscelides obtectus]|uniref:Uncharacterized protein n=1 Tax=Acanthoscelides obtectus TaxID=200917 RepID=A0A9P0P4R4_ACAOB|nr:unnamed protein product [Acanthoscelides obtectus]CAK1662499.1 hypothetical protein AOBTE_LOCUS23176 [Acanthoscelides obtectus]